jgi:hypothetical protein
MIPTGIQFLVNHLAHLHRAGAEGVPVKGYFHGSLMDNFEGSDGFTNRYGLVHVTYKTQKRTPKLSAAHFRKAARWSSRRGLLRLVVRRYANRLAAHLNRNSSPVLCCGM